jgi:hypothetical protein
MTLPLSPRDMAKLISLMAQASDIEARWRAVKDYRAFYAGDHPTFLTERQQEYLGPLLTQSEHTVAFNLCRLVVDTLRARLRIIGFTGDDTDTGLAELIGEWWNKTQMDLHQITLHRRALRDGAAYLIVGWNAELGIPTWTPNHVHDGVEGVTYHPDSETGQPRLALKHWTVSDPLSPKFGKNRRTVYLADRILRQQEDARGEYGWSDIDPDEGPAIEWWTDTRLPGGKPLGLACIEFANPGRVSELEDIIGLNMALDKTVLDMLADADSTGFSMFAISYPGPAPAGPTDDEELTSDDVKIAPGRATELYDGASMAKLPAGDLSQIIAAIHTLIGMIAAASGTPQHYLWPGDAGGALSGEAYKMLESALVSRANERTTLFGDAWVTAMRVGARLYGAMGNTVDAEAPLTPTWAATEIRNETADATTAQAHLALGVPMEILWQKLLGYTAEEVAEFKKLKAIEQAAQLANVVMAMRNTQPAPGAGAEGANNGSGRGPTQGAGGNGATGRGNGQSAVVGLPAAQ